MYTGKILVCRHGARRCLSLQTVLSAALASAHHQSFYLVLLSAVAHLLAPSQRALAADSPCWPGIPYSRACNRLIFNQSLTSAPGLLQNRLPLLQSAGAAWCSLASPTSTVLTQALPFLQIVPSIPGDALPPAACLAKHAFLQVRPAAWRPP